MYSRHIFSIMLVWFFVIEGFCVEPIKVSISVITDNDSDSNKPATISFGTIANNIDSISFWYNEVLVWKDTIRVNLSSHVYYINPESYVNITLPMGVEPSQIVFSFYNMNEADAEQRSRRTYLSEEDILLLFDTSEIVNQNELKSKISLEELFYYQTYYEPENRPKGYASIQFEFLSGNISEKGLNLFTFDSEGRSYRSFKLFSTQKDIYSFIFLKLDRDLNRFDLEIHDRGEKDGRLELTNISITRENQTNYIRSLWYSEDLDSTRIYVNKFPIDLNYLHAGSKKYSFIVDKLSISVAKKKQLLKLIPGIFIVIFFLMVNKILMMRKLV